MYFMQGLIEGCLIAGLYLKLSRVAAWVMFLLVLLNMIYREIRVANALDNPGNQRVYENFDAYNKKYMLEEYVRFILVGRYPLFTRPAGKFLEFLNEKLNRKNSPADTTGIKVGASPEERYAAISQASAEVRRLSEESEGGSPSTPGKPD